MPVHPLAHLGLATAAFLATHFVTSTPLRARLAGWLGERAYLGLYALVALLTLAWMVWAYRRVPASPPLWNGPRWVPAAVLPFAFMLLISGYFAPNPAALMREKLLRATEPARGMIRVTRHPLMWAAMLWAGAHLAVRADAAALVFFGGFLALAALGTVSMDRRKARTLGADWRRFAAVTSNLPFAAIAQGRNTLKPGEIGWIRPVAGLALYAVFFLLHPFLFGARPY